MAEPTEAELLMARLKSKNRPGRNSMANLSKLSFTEKKGTSDMTSSTQDLLPIKTTYEEGEPDSTTILSGMQIILKSIGGTSTSGCISVSTSQPSSNKGNKQPSQYRGVVEGFGFGDIHEVFTLSNRHERSSHGVTQLPIRFGDKINIKSHFAREKLLAPNYEKGGGTDIVFERNLPTAAEDWEVICFHLFFFSFS